MSSERKKRIFEEREPTDRPIYARIAITGPPGVGKTLCSLLTALGLGAGMEGGIGVVETELGRSGAYRKNVPHKVVPFVDPYDSWAYFDALAYSVARGYHTVIFDTMTPEHDDLGGVLETHSQIVKSLGNRKMAKTTAWGDAKRGRLQLVKALKTAPLHVIMVFRAKDKLSFRGDQAIPLGWVHVGGDEFFYETQINISLRPGADGVPCWAGKTAAEKADRKRPFWAREILNGQVTPADGEFIAAWLRGDQLRNTPTDPQPARPAFSIDPHLMALEKARTLDDLAKVDVDVKRDWRGLSNAQRDIVQGARNAAGTRLGDNRVIQGEDAE